MIAVLLVAFSALAAALGGFLALEKRRQLSLTLGFTAGVLLGLVAFEILPEIFEITSDKSLDILWPMAALTLGFLLFHTVEKFILIHHSHEQKYVIHKHPHVGVASALALTGHSFLDGMSIGLAFQVNESVGIAVSIAVIGHRFADGFNSVNLMLHHGNSRQRTLKLLVIVALAPIAGALSTMLFTLPQSALAIYLGFFAGLLLYISASDILPQAHSKSTSKKIIALTFLGVIFIFLITRLAH